MFVPSVLPPPSPISPLSWVRFGCISRLAAHISVHRRDLTVRFGNLEFCKPRASVPAPVARSPFTSHNSSQAYSVTSRGRLPKRPSVARLLAFRAPTEPTRTPKKSAPPLSSQGSEGGDGEGGGRAGEEKRLFMCV